MGVMGVGGLGALGVWVRWVFGCVRGQRFFNLGGCHDVS